MRSSPAQLAPPPAGRNPTRRLPLGIVALAMVLLGSTAVTGGQGSETAPAGELVLRVPELGEPGRAAYSYRVTLGEEELVVSGEGVRAGTHPLAGLERIRVEGSPADDTLTVDLQGGLRPLHIDYAGSAGFDTVVVEGSTVLDEVVYTPGPGRDEGILSYRLGTAELRIRFTGLEPVVDATAAATATVVATAAADGISYSQGTDATWGKVTVGDLESYEFQNKTELAILCGDGNDDVFLSNLNVPTGMTALTVQGEAGSEDFFVQAVPAGVTASIEGGAESDFYWVGSLGGGGNMDTIQGSLTLDGGDHAAGVNILLSVSGTTNSTETGDFVRLLDADNGVAHGYTVAPTSVTRDSVTVHLPNIEQILLATSGPAADVDVLGTPDGRYVEVETQGDADDIDVFDTGADSNLRLLSGGGADTVDIHGTGGDGGDTNSRGAFVVVDGGGGGDALTVRGTGSGGFVQLGGGSGEDQITALGGGAGGLLELLGSTGTDHLEVGSAGQPLDVVQSTVEVNGGSNGAGTTTLSIGGVDNSLDSGDLLSVHDDGETEPVTYTFFIPWMTRSGGPTVNFTSVETLVVHGGAGANTIGFESHSLNNLFVFTQGGDDTVLVDYGSAGTPNIFLDTGGGADTVTLAGFNEPFVEVDAGPGDDTLVVATEGSPNRRVRLEGDAGADQITVRRTPASGFVEVDGGDDNDVITLSGDGTATDGFLSALFGPVAVSGGAHEAAPTTVLGFGGEENVLPTGDVLNLADRSPCACTYTITPSSVARTGIPTVAYDTIETLNLVVGGDPNTLVVAGTGDATTTTITSDLFVDDDLTVEATGTDSNLVASLGSGADSVTLYDPGPDGDDDDDLGAFVRVDGGDGSSDSLTWLGSPATFVEGVPDLILPPGNQRIATTGFETETLETADFGDAPDSYRTLEASDGPRHGANGALFLGASWDAEPDGLPGASADGDGADDDGVVFTSDILVEPDLTWGSLSLTASDSGLVSAWIDFNADGDFDDADERILTDSAVVAGVNPKVFSSPAEVVPGATYARFRFSSAGALGPGGPGADGEVEDYRVTIRPVDHLDLSNRLESSSRSYWACVSISAGDTFAVLDGADVVLQAGATVELRDGVTVQAGGGLRIRVGAVPGCP